METLTQQSWDLIHAKSVAEIYEQAFGTKFIKAIADKQQRIAVLAQCFVPEFSFAAMDEGEIVGIAGFHTAQGSLTSGIGFRQLCKILGVLKGIKAGIIFSLFERKPNVNELVMDGIAVRHEYRGQGIGHQLLDHIINYAQENCFESVRLDVIDSNVKAKKLYESKGFVTVKFEEFSYLKDVLGFSGVTTMSLSIVNASPTS